MLNFFKSRSKQWSKSAAPSGGASAGKLAVTEVRPTPSRGSGDQAKAEANVEISMPADLPRVGLDDFDLLKVLGKGGFGKVMLVRRKDTSDIYAMKVCACLSLSLSQPSPLWLCLLESSMTP